jgi:hypothetical protein
MVGDVGIEPTTSAVSEQRSTNELIPHQVQRTSTAPENARRAGNLAEAVDTMSKKRAVKTSSVLKHPAHRRTTFTD